MILLLKVYLKTIDSVQQCSYHMVMNIDTEKLAKVIALIEKTANYSTRTDDNEDFNPSDASGGNFDDAYQIGLEDGEINFARELQSILE